jgi:hypothetical protein
MMDLFNNDKFKKLENRLCPGIQVKNHPADINPGAVMREVQGDLLNPGGIPKLVYGHEVPRLIEDVNVGRSVFREVEDDPCRIALGRRRIDETTSVRRILKGEGFGNKEEKGAKSYRDNGSWMVFNERVHAGFLVFT